MMLLKKCVKFLALMLWVGEELKSRAPTTAIVVRIGGWKPHGTELLMFLMLDNNCDLSTIDENPMMSLHQMKTNLRSQLFLPTRHPYDRAYRGVKRLFFTIETTHLHINDTRNLWPICNVSSTYVYFRLHLLYRTQLQAVFVRPPYVQ